jgi:hypothetical protein
VESVCGFSELIRFLDTPLITPYRPDRLKLRFRSSFFIDVANAPSDHVEGPRFSNCSLSSHQPVNPVVRTVTAVTLLSWQNALVANFSMFHPKTPPPPLRAPRPVRYSLSECVALNSMNKHYHCCALRPPRRLPNSDFLLIVGASEILCHVVKCLATIQGIYVIRLARQL